MKNLHQITCANMFNLLSLFSSSDFLMEDKDNYICLVKFLKIMENIIIHQSDSNVNLIYEILARQKDILTIKKIKFEDLQQHLQQNIKRNATTKESIEEEKNDPPTPNSKVLGNINIFNKIDDSKRHKIQIIIITATTITITITIMKICKEMKIWNGNNCFNFIHFNQKFRARNVREQLSLDNFVNIIKFLNFHLKSSLGDIFEEEKVLFHNNLNEIFLIR